MPIRAEGRFTLTDVWRGSRLASRRTLVPVSLIGLFVLASVLFLGMFTAKVLRERWILILLGLFWTFYLWVALLYQSHRMLKRSPNLQGTVSYQSDVITSPAV